MNDFVGPVMPTSQDITVNVPKNTSSNVVGDILNNLPNILGALGGFFGKKEQQYQQQQTPVAQDMTPIYLLGGLALVILLTRK
jgi:hypothetical protein